VGHWGAGDTAGLLGIVMGYLFNFYTQLSEDLIEVRKHQNYPQKEVSKDF